MDGWLRAARGIAWTALAGVAGVLIYAEAAPTRPPEGVRAYRDIIYRRAGTRSPRLDVYVPDSGAAPVSGRPVLVAIHGGGWRGGTKNGYGREIARIARHGYAVVSVEYVLSGPGRPSWPENLDDVREAVRWVRRHAADYAIDPTRIAAIGSSAGGHLAALLGTNAGGADPGSRVQAVVDLYGPTDLARLYRSPGAVVPLETLLGKPPGDAPGLYDDASPVAHASCDAAPTLIIHGEDDDTVPLAQSSALTDRLRAAGVPARLIVVPGVGHAFGLEVAGRDLVPEILSFLEVAWARAGRYAPGDPGGPPIAAHHPNGRGSTGLPRAEGGD